MKLTNILLAATCILAKMHVALAFAPFHSVTSRQRGTCGQLFAAPLAREGDWAAYLDEDTTGLVYFFNKKTGESMWKAPTETFPAVYLTPQQRISAKSKQKEYDEAATKAKAIASGKTSFFGFLKEKPKEALESSVSEEKKVEPMWFDGLFEKKEEREMPKSGKPVEELIVLKDTTVNPFANLFNTGGEKPATIVEANTIEDSGTQIVEDGVMDDDTEPRLNVFDLNLNDEIDAETQKSNEVAQSTFGFGDLMATLLSKTEEITEKSSKPKRKVKASSKITEEVVTNENAIIAPELTNIKIEMSGYVLPHPAKVRWGGEDAIFTKGRTFGVFDGVSGADKKDGVPLYSITLAQEMQATVGKKPHDIKELTSLLSDAAAVADKSATGASTAIVASLSETGKLSVLNVGDSYCYVIREGKVFSKSKEIVHYFECPYQLSEDSPDRPKDGTKLNVYVQPGDIILMGTDGVFDNLSDEKILNAVAESPKKASRIAKTLVDLSRAVSLDSDAVTPFAKLAKRNGFEEYESGLGGKLDDISCVVVRCS